MGSQRLLARVQLLLVLGAIFGFSFAAHRYASFKVNALRQRTHANSLHGSTAHDVEQLNATMHTKLAVNSFDECAHRKGR
jgi:hypothetical protein